MILCLDAGNSRIKFGLLADSGWRTQGALSYAAFADLAGKLPAKPARILACNVAGEPIRRRIETLANDLAVPLAWLTSSPSACGVTNAYDAPLQLGADRWAALIGARELHLGPSIVVMAGTATTIDVLDRQAVFRGGLILPGLTMMLTALAQNTAGLPSASGHYRPLPSNTDDAIVSGAVHATLGAIQRMQTALGDDAVCLISGGAAAVVAPYLDLPHRVVDNLVLEGLARYSRSCSFLP